MDSDCITLLNVNYLYVISRQSDIIITLKLYTHVLCNNKINWVVDFVIVHVTGRSVILNSIKCLRQCTWFIRHCLTGMNGAMRAQSDNRFMKNDYDSLCIPIQPWSRQKFISAVWLGSWRFSMLLVEFASSNIRELIGYKK